MLHRLYIRSRSSNRLVQLTIAHQLREAAKDSIATACTAKVIVESDVMRDAAEALRSLSTLLDRDEYYFGSAQASLFDAGVFAYTHLLLSERLGWCENALGDEVRQYDNLVQHERRLARLYERGTE